MTSIGDYALIGDGRSAALVSRSGSIDWLCWPRFDSPPLFGALVDDERGGRFSMRVDGSSAARRYLPGTNVLETRLSTAGGELALTDLMPVAMEQSGVLQAEHELLRIARCTRGEVAVQVLFQPRPLFGRNPFRLRRRGALGIRVEAGGELYTLRGERELQVHADGSARASFVLRAGERVSFVLSMAATGPGVVHPLGDVVEDDLERTTAWWRGWVEPMRYEGEHREAIERSALALKLLQYAPSGAIVAAPTTSLPERVGATLNWDYRFCWLRDAALTTRALFGLGFHDEAHAFVSWLLHATRQSQPSLDVLYDVFGRRPPREQELEELEGFRGSRPVRLGNAASEQMQLDIYAEVMEATIELVRHAGRLDGETGRMLRRLGEYVCRHWREPDDGIWEPRDGRRHNTHSKALCWVALNCLLILDESQPLRLPQRLFRREMRAIRDAVEEEGYRSDLQSYVSVLGGQKLDASLLQLMLYGFTDPSSPRAKGTCAMVQERLGAGGGLLYRTEKSPEEEGAFLICSFWLVEALARGAGTLRQAEDIFSAAMSCANDVGLLAEEVDPRSRELLGNFPQGFSHIGAITAALALQERRERERHRVPEPAARPSAPQPRGGAP